MNAAITPTIAPVAPQAPAPQAAPQGQRGFKQALAESQAQAQEPASAASEAAPAQPQGPDRAAERARAGKAAGNEEAKRAEAKRNETKRTETKAEQAEPEEGAAPAEASAAEDAAADPALADWLAALNLPSAQPEARAEVAEDPKGTALEGQTAKRARGTLDARVGDGAERGGKDARERVEATRDAAGKHALAQAAEPAMSHNTAWKDAMERAEPAVAQDTHNVNALAAPAHAGASARSAEAAAPVVVSLPTPAAAPEFAQSLGVQVSVLATEGVQQAELHLNPAEMGPISVQIAIDGTQAQVNFGADVAATREIIERGLPELAAALREAGFTLAGGGVHSQARGREDGGDAPRGEGGAAEGRASAVEPDAAAPRRAAARVSAGGLDVYA